MVTSVHLTSVALKRIIRTHAESGSHWPQVLCLRGSHREPDADIDELMRTIQRAQTSTHMPCGLGSVDIGAVVKPAQVNVRTHSISEDTFYIRRLIEYVVI